LLCRKDSQQRASSTCGRSYVTRGPRLRRKGTCVCSPIRKPVPEVHLLSTGGISHDQQRRWRVYRWRDLEVRGGGRPDPRLLGYVLLCARLGQWPVLVHWLPADPFRHPVVRGDLRAGEGRVPRRDDDIETQQKSALPEDELNCAASPSQPLDRPRTIEVTSYAEVPGPSGQDAAHRRSATCLCRRNWCGHNRPFSAPPPAFSGRAAPWMFT